MFDFGFYWFDPELVLVHLLGKWNTKSHESCFLNSVFFRVSYAYIKCNDYYLETVLNIQYETYVYWNSIKTQNSI